MRTPFHANLRRHPAVGSLAKARRKPEETPEGAPAETQAKKVPFVSNPPVCLSVSLGNVPAVQCDPQFNVTRSAVFRSDCPAGQSSHHVPPTPAKENPCPDRCFAPLPRPRRSSPAWPSRQAARHPSRVPPGRPLRHPPPPPAPPPPRPRRC